ncbi:MAG TPA: GAF domain-containing sensor histidine kinase [Candidatus Saccharimonadales bacterium]|nr:GAF domain-containing sensor histidine kinase [Candidatus Saccharimonadales bacterium]
MSGEIKRREEVERLAKEKTETLGELERRNKNLATLQKISGIVLNEVDFKPMAQKLLDEIPKQIEGSAGSFLSIVKNGQLVAYAFSSNESVRKVQGLVGVDLEKYASPIRESYSLLHKTLTTNRPTESGGLVEYFCPPLSKVAGVTLEKLLNIRYATALPLYAHGEPLGVMVFGFNRSKDQIDEKAFEVTNAVASDMSLALQRAAAFQKLKDANEYLSQLDKMKDEFISMASHELNTPLAAIEGYLSMVLDEKMGTVDDKAREYLTRAFSSSKRLAELILDLLNVSRIEQGRLKMAFAETDLTDIAKSVINELQIKADSKKLYLKLEAGKNIPKIWCDPDRIREVFVNLTGNAIKFTDKGGITIKVERVDDTAVRCSVNDTGRGIAADDQKKLFQKFSQVHREIDEHQGTGLGLYISKNFVELHKGRLWVESAEGKGAKFTFELPITKEPPATVDGAILDGPLSTPKIVRADDKIPSTITDSAKVR